MQFTRQIQYLHSRLAPEVPIEHFIDAIKPAAIGLEDKSQYYAPVRFSVQVCGEIKSAAGAIRVDVPVHANPNWLSDMKKRFAGMIGLKNTLSNVDLTFKTVNGTELSQVRTEDLPRIGKLKVYVGDKQVRLPNMPLIPVEYSVCKEANIQTWLNQVSSDLPELIAHELCKLKSEAEIDRAVRGDGKIVEIIAAKIAPSPLGWGDFLRVHHMNSPDSIDAKDAKQTLSLISKDMLGNVRRFIEASHKPISAYLQSLEAKQIAKDLSQRGTQDVEHYKPIFGKLGRPAEFTESPYDMFHKIAEDALASPIVHQSVIATIYNRPISYGCTWTTRPDIDKLRKEPSNGGDDNGRNQSVPLKPKDKKPAMSEQDVPAMVDAVVQSMSIFLQNSDSDFEYVIDTNNALLAAIPNYGEEESKTLFTQIFNRLSLTENVRDSIQPVLDADRLPYYLNGASFQEIMARFLESLIVFQNRDSVLNRTKQKLVYDDEARSVFSWSKTFGKNVQDAVRYMNLYVRDQPKESISRFVRAYGDKKGLDLLDNPTLWYIADQFGVQNTTMKGTVYRRKFYDSSFVPEIYAAIEAYMRDPNKTSSGRQPVSPVEPVPQKYEFDWPDEDEDTDASYDPKEDDLSLPNRNAKDRSTAKLGDENESIVLPNPKDTTKGEWIQFMRNNYEKFSFKNWLVYLYDAPVSKKGLISSMNGKMLEVFVKNYVSGAYTDFQVLPKESTIQQQKKNITDKLQTEKKYFAEITAHHPWNAQIHHTLQPLADGAYPTYYNLLHTKQDMSKNAAYSGDLAETYKAYHMFAGLPISPPGLLIERRAPAGRKPQKHSGKSGKKHMDEDEMYRGSGGSRFMKSEMPPLVPLKSNLQPIECGSCGGHNDSDSDDESSKKQMPAKSRIGSAMPPLIPLKSALQPIECGNYSKDDSDSDSEDASPKKQAPAKSRIGSAMPPLVPLKSALQPIECGSCGGHKKDDSDSEDASPKKQMPSKSRIGSALPPLIPLNSQIPERPPLIRLDKLQAKIRSRLVPIESNEEAVGEYANEEIGETFGLPTCNDIFGPSELL